MFSKVGDKLKVSAWAVLGIVGILSLFSGIMCIVLGGQLNSSFSGISDIFGGYGYRSPSYGTPFIILGIFIILFGAVIAYICALIIRGYGIIVNSTQKLAGGNPDDGGNPEELKAMFQDTFAVKQTNAPQAAPYTAPVQNPAPAPVQTPTPAPAPVVTPAPAVTPTPAPVVTPAPVAAPAPAPVEVPKAAPVEDLEPVEVPADILNEQEAPVEEITEVPEEAVETEEAPEAEVIPEEAPAAPQPEANAVRFCNKCGAPVEPEYAFCMKCGNKLK